MPLLLSPANDPFVMHNELEPHGFVRIVNQSDQSGSVRILAVDDAGNAANPVEMQFRTNKLSSLAAVGAGKALALPAAQVCIPTDGAWMQAASQISPFCRTPRS